MRSSPEKRPQLSGLYNSGTLTYRSTKACGGCLKRTAPSIIRMPRSTAAQPFAGSLSGGSLREFSSCFHPSVLSRGGGALPQIVDRVRFFVPLIVTDLQQQLLRTALEFLEINTSTEKGLSIQEVSARLGFCDQFCFARRFKARFQATPTQYRRHNRYLIQQHY